jgi:hypothetical protein
MSHNQSYLKASIDGLNGSGKSGTSARLAVGISKELCGGAPVVAYSSDDRRRIYKRTIFDVEKIPLTVVSGESLNQVSESIRIAEKGCCMLVQDDLTLPWKEGLSQFSYEDGYLPFERREQLINEWRPTIRAIRLGKFHAIDVGRIGYPRTEGKRLMLRRPLPLFKVKPEQSLRYELIQPGVIRYADGREVCLDAPDGRREYKRRIELMLKRQNGSCCLCRKRIHSIHDATFEHQRRRGIGSAFRDDSVERDGKPYNGAAHWICNFVKG